MRYLVPGPLPCPEVVAVSYIRQAKVPTLFSVEGDAQVEQQNTVVGFITMDKMTDKEAELNVIQDCIAILTLDLRAAMQCLSRAKAVTRIEDRCTMAVSQHALSAWVVEQGHST